MPFEFLHWNNDAHNIGSDALRYLLDDAQGKYFVITEDDMLWFEKNWLKKLVEAFELGPGLTQEGIALGFRDEWGMLATNTTKDSVNWDMRREDYPGLIEFKRGKYWFWGNIRAGGGPIIMRTDVLRALQPFPEKSYALNGALAHIQFAYERALYPSGRVRNIYCYHAFTPYWNTLYPDVFKEKQKGRTIEEEMRLFQGKGFDFTDTQPREALKSGTFNRYAKGVYKKNLSDGI